VPEDTCRTVALWFYVLVFNHNARDPVTQKKLQFTAEDFLHTLRMYFSTFLHWSIKYLMWCPYTYLMFLDLLVHLSSSSHFHRIVKLFVLNSLPCWYTGKNFKTQELIGQQRQP
jgi:hypothetical protein